MLQHLGMCCEQLHPEEGLDVQEEVRVVHEEGHVVQSLKELLRAPRSLSWQDENPFWCKLEEDQDFAQDEVIDKNMKNLAMSQPKLTRTPLAAR